MWPCTAKHWATVKKSQLGTSHILTGHPCLKFSLSVNRVTGRNSVQGWRTSLFGKRRFFHLANSWEFSGVSGMTQAAFPRGKMLLGGHPPLHPSQPQGWTPAPRGDVPLPSRTWKHHLGILPFPWATSVGGSRIRWQKAVSEAVPFSVLLLPAPAMAITCPKQDPSVLTQSSFGLRFKRVWELLCYQ